MDFISPLLLFSTIVISLTLLRASVFDFKYRIVPFHTWLPMIAVSLPIAIILYITILIEDTRIFTPIILAVVCMCAAYYIASRYLNVFGGADAFALIFITAFMPVNPLTPLIPESWIGFLPAVVIMNAILFYCAFPIGLVIRNMIKKEKMDHYPVPFIIPITAGFFTALLIGDLTCKIFFTFF